MKILDAMSVVGFILGMICLFSELVEYMKDKMRKD